MLLTEYYNLPELARIQAAKEEALLTGQKASDVYGFLERACSHFDQDKLVRKSLPVVTKVKALAATAAVQGATSVTEAARELGISRSTLYRRLEQQQ